MRKFVVLAVILTIGLSGTVMAQKKHAPKSVWTAMVAGLNDIQSITGALAVFDMKRAAEIADGLAKRETFISTIERLPEPVRKGHADVAKVAKELADAARAGEEQQVAQKIGEVLGACSACHYNIRDAERRKKME
jgi:hypothetical protein